MKFKLIDKVVFFPEKGILAVGDLHIGYEKMMISSGVLVPEIQVKDITKDLEKTINKIKLEGGKIKKVIFLGDIKHFFSYERSEKFNFNRVVEFLKKYVKEEDIILIKGNHDKFDFSGKPMKNSYFNEGILFLHGHKEFPGTFDKRVKMIVMGHLHPSVRLSDKVNVKKEKYRCFMTGNYKRKKVIILPSFPNIIRGYCMNDGGYHKMRKLRKLKYIMNPSLPTDFSIIPFRSLENFDIHVIGDNGEIFNFGKLKKL